MISFYLIFEFLIFETVAADNGNDDDDDDDDTIANTMNINVNITITIGLSLSFFYEITILFRVCFFRIFLFHLEHALGNDASHSMYWFGGSWCTRTINRWRILRVHGFIVHKTASMCLYRFLSRTAQFPP